MKLPNAECAQAVRDCSVDAMDALNEILYMIEGRLSAEERQALRRVLADAADLILTRLVNPVLRDFPELAEDEDKWGEIAIEQARRRIAESVNRPALPPLNEELFALPFTREGRHD